MKKTIHILSILSIAIAAIAIVWLGVVILFQGPLVELMIARPTQSFAVPLSPILSAFSALFFSLILFLFNLGNKTSIAGELCLLILRLGVFPFFSWVLSYCETYLRARLYGSEEAIILQYNMVNSFCNLPMMISSLSFSLFLLVCGMSIAYKRMTCTQTEKEA